MQGTSGVRLTFSNFNFTFVSQFETLGLQGEAAYYFAGNVQGSVRTLHLSEAAWFHHPFSLPFA